MNKSDNFLDLTPKGKNKLTGQQRNDELVKDVTFLDTDNNDFVDSMVYGMKARYQPKKRKRTNWLLLFFVALLTIPALIMCLELRNVDRGYHFLITPDDIKEMQMEREAQKAYEKHLAIEEYLLKLRHCESSNGKKMWNDSEDSVGWYQFHLPSDTLSDLTEQFYGYRVPSRDIAIAIAKNFQEAHAIAYLAVEDGQKWRWENCNNKIINGEYDHLTLDK